jgi:hypothetical protein
MAALMMTAALLGSPVAVPNRLPGRDRRGFHPWRAFMGWLGRRRPGGKQ